MTMAEIKCAVASAPRDRRVIRLAILASRHGEPYTTQLASVLSTERTVPPC